MKSILFTTLNSKYIHSSLALRYLQAFSRQEGILNIQLKEYSINEMLADIMADIYTRRPDILCFSCYIWNIREILEICHDYKKVSPETVIVLGGPEVSYDADLVLLNNPGIDFIIRGEGEVSLKELLLALNNREPLKDLRGISYRAGEGLCHNPDQPLIKDLDIIPFSYPADLKGFKDKIIYYESSRGCPFNCAYCLSSVQRGVRFFSMDRVKRDLAVLISQEVREVKFVDRTFNCHETRAMEIMSFIMERNPVSKFHFELDASLISDEMLKFLADVPPDMFNFEIGIQSTCPEALQAVQRIFNWESLRKNIHTLRSYNNIHLHLDLIAGLPYEGYEQFAQSFNDVYSLEPDNLQLGFLKLLKGSKMREMAGEYGYTCQEQAPYQVLDNNYISYAEIIKLKQIEQMLDKYHNSGDLPQSIAYIIAKVYDNDAFAFFEDLASWWETNQLFGIGHRKEKHYSYLLSFIAEHHKDHLDIINDLAKYDFLMNNRADILPVGFKGYNPDNAKEIYNYIKDEAFLKKYLGSLGTKSSREIKKNLHLEYFAWDPERKVNKYLGIIFVYDPVKKCAIRTIRLE